MVALELTFLSEPSLQKNDPRQRDLALATAKAHSAHWMHRSRAAGILSTPSRTVWFRSKPLAKHKKRRVVPRGQDAVDLQPLIKAKLLIPKPPALSSYLNEAYSHERASAVHINGLYDFFYSSFGPAYCWPALTDDSERLMFKGRVIDAFLNDPAHSEAMLALLQVFRDRADEPPGKTDISTTALRHQSNALSLLRVRLDDPESARQPITLWTIVSHLILNEAINDWKSFGTNMRGLQLVLDIQGGMKKIQMVDGRLYQFIRLIEHVHTQYQDYAVTNALSANPTKISSKKFASPETPPPFGEDVVFRLGHWRHTSERRLAKQLPKGILDLYRVGRIRREVAVWLGLGVDWLRQHQDPAWNDPVWEAPVQELLQSLRSPGLSQAETYICVALSIILCSIDMSDGHQRGQNLNTMEHEIRCHVIRLYGDRHRKSGSTSHLRSSTPFEDYEVWTSLVVVSMYMDILSPWPCHVLSDWLGSYVAADKDNRLATWSGVSAIASKFYMNETLEARWRYHWKIASAAVRDSES